MLSELAILGLTENAVSDLSALVSNQGLTRGDTITLTGNPIDFSPESPAIRAVKALIKRGVNVDIEP
jgi:hypothetical protein